MVLSKAGVQVPAYPFIEVVGNGSRVPPTQIGLIALNVGVIFGVTVMFTVLVVAH